MANERERQILALRANAPKRADAGAVIQQQDDESALPLFGATDEPPLFRRDQLL